MSKFLTISPIVQGAPKSASTMFTASTEDDLATILTTGYMNDKAARGIVKRNDIVNINYDVDDSVQPPANLTPATYGVFRVEIVATDYNLVAFP